MFAKLLLVCLTLGCARAGFIAPAGVAYASPYSSYPAQPAVSTQQQNILRTPWNLGQVTSFSKTVDTPYSSVSKSDVRISNPGIAVGHTPWAAPWAAPALAPAVHGGIWGGHLGLPAVAPVAKIAAPGLLGVAYSAAPAVSHMTYSNALGVAYAW